MSEPASGSTSRHPIPAEPPAAPPPPRWVTRHARRAVGRRTGGERTLLTLVGLVLLAAGALVALLSRGIFGTGRAGRPVLDPLIVESLRTQPLAWRAGAIGVGLVLLVLGLVWAVHALRPERRPDLHLAPLGERGETSVRVEAPAVGEAVAEHAASLPGVGRARARMVGSVASPALRLTVWLTEDADVADVCTRLETEVMAEARRSLDLVHLPVAVRLELDSATSAPRVA